MPYAIVEPTEFLSDGVFREGTFLEIAESFDWEQYLGKQVLVRGCESAIIPPWAFMYLTGKLAVVARTVRFGNEHDNILVFRAPGKERTNRS